MTSERNVFTYILEDSDPPDDLRVLHLPVGSKVIGVEVLASWDVQVYFEATNQASADADLDGKTVEYPVRLLVTYQGIEDDPRFVGSWSVPGGISSLSLFDESG